MLLRFPGDVIVIGDCHRCVAVERHELSATVRQHGMIVFGLGRRKYAVLEGHGVPTCQDVTDEFVVMWKFRKKIVERDDEFVVGSLNVLRYIEVDAVGCKVICHALWIAVIPCIEITLYKLCCMHSGPPIQGLPVYKQQSLYSTIC